MTRRPLAITSSGVMPKSSSPGNSNARQPRSRSATVVSDTHPRNGTVGPARDSPDAPFPVVRRQRGVVIKLRKRLHSEIDALAAYQPGDDEEVILTGGIGNTESVDLHGLRCRRPADPLRASRRRNTGQGVVCRSYTF